MYKSFFGLQKNPFNMTPDPACVFLTPQHREAFAGLTYAILEQKGFVVLTGDAGTGKTTLLSKTLRFLPPARIHSSVILNPTLTTAEFLEMAMLDFGLKDIPASKAQRITILQHFLMQASRDGRIAVLVVDEAHKLSPEVLEEIRLLGNFEHSDRKLLQILLVGQNELGDVLDREDLRQLKQRIALRFSIQALSAADVAEYIRFRWSRAGGSAFPFTDESIAGIAAASRGIPRVINAVCDNCLTLAFGSDTRTVTAAHVKEVCVDLHLASNGIVAAAQPVEPVAAPAEPESKPVPEFQIMGTLERYGATPKPSFVARWASRLGFAQRTQSV